MGIKPLPRTDRKRFGLFNPDKPQPSTRKSLKIIPKAQIIKEMANKTGGINLKLWTRAKKGIKKIQGIYGKTLTPKEITIRQALFIDQLAAEFADHLIEGVKKVGSLESTAKNAKINFNGLSQQQIEKKVWEYQFADFIKTFVKYNPKSSEVIRTLQKIRRYTKVPLQVHFERSRHWNSLHKIEEELLRKKINPEENLKLEVKRTLQRKRNTPIQQSKKLARLKALDIIVASSIYADLIMETKGEKIKDKIERERFWNNSYSEGMEKIYPLLSKEEEILQAIIDFNKESPRGKEPLPRRVEE
jgi:hypothetical protein